MYSEALRYIHNLKAITKSWHVLYGSTDSKPQFYKFLFPSAFPFAKLKALCKKVNQKMNM